VHVLARHALALALAGATAAGCSTLLGLDGDFSERAGTTGAGAAGAGGAGGGVGLGGTGAGHDAGTGGTGHAGGAPNDAGAGGAPNDAGDAGALVCGDPCYDGPPGSLFASSACHEGTVVCVDGGATCEGQALPATPSVPGDDANCDQIGDLACLPRASFAMPTGVALGTTDLLPSVPSAARLTPSGDVVLTGTVGEAPCGQPSCDRHTFVAVVRGTDGALLTSIDPTRGAGSSAGQGVALSPSGSTACATGTFAGALSFDADPGAPTIQSGDHGACYVAWLALPGQAYLDQRVIAEGCVGAPAAVVLDDGSTVVAGTYSSEGGLSIGDAHVGAPSGGLDDGFVVAFGPAPKHALAWAKQLDAEPGDGGSSGVAVRAITRDGAGNLWVGGDFQGKLRVSDGVELTSKGGSDVFFLVLGPDGVVVKARSCGSPADDQLRGLVASAAGDEIALMATRDGNTTFYCGNMGIGGSGDGVRPVLARMTLDATMQSLGGMPAQGTATVTAVAAHPAGYYVVGGDVNGMLVPDPASTVWDGWVRLLDATHVAVAAATLGGAGDQHVTAVDVSPWTGAIFAAGTAQSELSASPLPKRPLPGGGGFGLLLWP
jgi:hypothetical protein